LGKRRGERTEGIASPKAAWKFAFRRRGLGEREKFHQHYFYVKKGEEEKRRKRISL